MFPLSYACARAKGYEKIAHKKTPSAQKSAFQK